MPRIALTVVFLGVLSALPTARTVLLPNVAGSIKLAVIGDNGTGDTPQLETASQMAAIHRQFPFALVLMMGDNFYGSQKPADLERKFARPYRALLELGVVFRAALGNHDDISTIRYAPIGMEGRRYYSHAHGNVRFFVLDTNVLDAPQLRWADTALQQATEDWRIAYFHHPLYGNAGRHGANLDVRVLLEPLLLKHGVQVVLSGHDHVYERLNPQKGIHYFVVGSGGQLRRGDLRRSATTAAGFDQDRAFMLAEIAGDDLHFQTVSRDGSTVDSGRIRRIPNRLTTAR